MPAARRNAARKPTNTAIWPVITPAARTRESDEQPDRLDGEADRGDDRPGEPIDEGTADRTRDEEAGGEDEQRKALAADPAVGEEEGEAGGDRAVAVGGEAEADARERRAGRDDLAPVPAPDCDQDAPSCRRGVEAVSTVDSSPRPITVHQPALALRPPPSAAGASRGPAARPPHIESPNQPRDPPGRT